MVECVGQLVVSEDDGGSAVVKLNAAGTRQGGAVVARHRTPVDDVTSPHHRPKLASLTKSHVVEYQLANRPKCWTISQETASLFRASLPSKLAMLTSLMQWCKRPHGLRTFAAVFGRICWFHGAEILPTSAVETPSAGRVCGCTGIFWPAWNWNTGRVY